MKEEIIREFPDDYPLKVRLVHCPMDQSTEVRKVLRFSIDGRIYDLDVEGEMPKDRLERLAHVWGRNLKHLYEQTRADVLADIHKKYKDLFSILSGKEIK